MRKTSSASSTKTKESCRRSSSGTSSRSRSFRLGRISERIPARCAARTFSLIPPTGSTLPRSVISPVMATSLCTGRRVASEASAVMIVTPAEGPSLGMAPSQPHVDGLALEELGIDGERLGMGPHVEDGGLRTLAHDVAEHTGQDQALFGARHHRHLHEQHIPTGRRPCQTRRNTRVPPYQVPRRRLIGRTHADFGHCRRHPP